MGEILKGYSIKSLENGIDASKKNIKVFEDAIKKERRTIADYRRMIEVLKAKAEPQVTIEIDAGQYGDSRRCDN